MASELCTSLRLIDRDLSGKLLQIVEDDSSSANFMLGSLMWNASRTGTSVCLLALHNSLAHYQLVTKKLGFNLKSAVENKTAAVLDPFSMYFEGSQDLGAMDMAKEGNVKRLFADVKTALNSMSGKKCLMIDDLSDMMAMGVGVAAAITFLQCCRSLQESDKDLSLIVGSHTAEDCHDHRLLANFLSHVADFRVVIAPLRTGFSPNVSGNMEVVDNLDGTFTTVVDKKLLQFKLTDRQIKVFAPGTVGIPV